MALGYCLKTEHGSTVSLRQQSCQLLALLHNLLPVTIKRLLPQSHCIAAIRHSQYVACYRPADFPHRHLEVMDDFALPAAIGLLSPGYHLAVLSSTGDSVQGQSQVWCPCCIPHPVCVTGQR
eukprot:GHUV01035220.1.p1 GENE.GHUV01035220.1~~GHUV01035220.1.p1  ORF type:complete len:122 (-),score=20.74 GHUV01035220.1:101-466(-)